MDGYHSEVRGDHSMDHIVYNILKPREIEDEEAWAYCIGYVTEMFYRLYSQTD